MGAGGADDKAAVRARLAERRRALPAAEVEARGALVQARLLQSLEFGQARTLALYAALAGEVPTDRLLQAALAAGKTVCFPVVPGQGRVLSFRSVRDAEELVPAGRLGIREPGTSSPLVPLVSIDLFVVPGLGFTRDGHRLGRGGGYYDATLRAAPARSRRVGLAFSEQVLEALPLTAADVAMDLVVTEDAAHPGPRREL